MEITGVKLRNSYHLCYVDTNNLFIKSGSLCIVETEHGIDIGKVCKKNVGKPGKDMEVKGKLLRVPTSGDIDRLPEIESIETRAFNICREKAHEKNLDMKLVSVKCLFDKTKIIFYFVADNRIDFRELVRDLAAVFRTRIEMRQIGVRDESRLIGGFGPCGRELCCTHMKEEFEPVSIKMAKEQSLNLNSLKISGMCGRLLCCLSYEYEVYREMYQKLPRYGTEIRIAGKVYTVDSVDPLKQSIRLRSEDHTVTATSEDITLVNGHFSISDDVIRRITPVEEEDPDEDFRH